MVVARALFDPVKRHTSPLAIIVYLLALLTCTVVIPILNGGTHMALSFSDEFSGPAGTPPDPNAWSFVDNQPPGGGNNEMEYYIPDASALDGSGRLAITAARDTGRFPAWYGPSQFTSGKIWTRGKVEFRYGHIEVRAQFPDAGKPGSWPAIWLYGCRYSRSWLARLRRDRHYGIYVGYS